MFIRSERLFLRPGWPEDWADLLQAIDDERVLRNLGHVPNPYTGDDARSFLERPPQRFLPRFLITLPGARTRLIGVIGLRDLGAGVELGYWIAPEHWGRGYASEAARAVLDLARALGHKSIAARHLLDNPASGRVLEKVGFRPTGRIVERFSSGRGKVCPAREYELVFGSPGGHVDGEDFMGCRRAA